MSKVAVIGSPGSAEVFRALGARLYPCSNPTKVEELLDRIKDEYAVIFITEDIALSSEVLMKRNIENDLPAITLLPVSGAQGGGVERLKAAVEKAIGADILGLGGE